MCCWQLAHGGKIRGSNLWLERHGSCCINSLVNSLQHNPESHPLFSAHTVSHTRTHTLTHNHRAVGREQKGGASCNIQHNTDAENRSLLNICQRGVWSLSKVLKLAHLSFPVSVSLFRVAELIHWTPSKCSSNPSEIPVSFEQQERANRQVLGWWPFI